MTVYVSLQPYAGHPDKPDLYHLWADTSDEAVLALYTIGGTITQRRQGLTAWEVYLIDDTQLLEALTLPTIKATNGLGPVWWLAVRNSDVSMLARIAAAGGPFNV